MSLVGIDPAHLESYPHQLSGGMRQRAMIAMALLYTPQLVIMDEPTSALDVVAQRSLMSKIKELQRNLGFAVIFVTHDMSVVSRYSDRVLVMYAGQVAEAARTEAIFDRPLHPYTRGLMNAFPSVRGPRRELVGIPGGPRTWLDRRAAVGSIRAAPRSCRPASSASPSSMRSTVPRFAASSTPNGPSEAGRLSEPWPRRPTPPRRPARPRSRCSERST